MAKLPWSGAGARIARGCAKPYQQRAQTQANQSPSAAIPADREMEVLLPGGELACPDF